MKWLSRFALLLTLALFVGSFATGCNTIEGAGEDIQQAGKKVEEAAD